MPTEQADLHVRGLRRYDAECSRRIGKERSGSGPLSGHHAEGREKARRALHPADNVVYGAERQVITSLRSGSKRRRKGRAPVYRHGSCPVAHRSPEAAAKCRNR